MAIKYTEEQLNTVDKSIIIQMFLNQQEELSKAVNQIEQLTKEVQSGNDKLQRMMEQIILSNNARFGRSSEKMDNTDQISFMEVDGNIIFFNESEAVCDLSAEEPEDLEPKPRGKKKVGKKEADMSGLPVNRVNHYMTEEELIAEFGENGWKQLPDAISKRYKLIENPKIGVAGLNPHCGENGLFGTEEIEEIQPAIDEAMAEGINIPEKKPTPPDSIFSKAIGGWYDIVVAMYHDQGHIPLKVKGFVYNKELKKWDAVAGVNVTLGIPVIRVSVDHGTGFDLAGKGESNELSLVN